MRVPLWVLVFTVSMSGCASKCPQETDNELNYKSTSELTLDGVAASETQALTMFLDDRITLTAPPAPELGQGIVVPTASPK